MIEPIGLTDVPSIVIISDRVERSIERGDAASASDGRWDELTREQQPWPGGAAAQQTVTGGYLERLPLACIAAGLVEQAEIWHHRLGGGHEFHRAGPRLAHRAFGLDVDAPPFNNGDMLAFVRRFGAPHVLLVYGLGVGSDLLAACAESVIVYNSIDAPSLRVPPEVSAHFDLVLTGAQWQSDEVDARHPGMATAILPVGPEFAAADMFRPLAGSKDYDLIYVAAAQAYKRHDILFDALDRLPRDVRGLCVFGYGENADALRDDIRARNLSIDCIGPPGVSFDEINRLMNRARFGVVCGRDDGAPAILTEYMLAGLPVLANAALACGTQYIRPETGMLADAEDFAEAIWTMRTATERFAPRETVLARWTWPHSVKRFRRLIEDAKRRKMRST